MTKGCGHDGYAQFPLKLSGHASVIHSIPDWKPAMKRNTHTLPESAELLRLILPLMSRHKIPVTPNNYAVWYEYAAGTNQNLNARIDTAMKLGEENVSEELTTALYREFFDVNSEMHRLEKAQQLFATLHDNVTRTLEQAYGKTSEYGQTLSLCQTRMTQGLSNEQLSLLIGDLSSSTSHMARNSRHLLRELNDSRDEISTLKKQLLEMKKQVKTDSLTALANRKAFFELVGEMESSGDFLRGKHSLLMLDIDHFKKVNDTFGHLFGDKVIKAVAMVLKKHTKGKDIAARFGGEEFIVLLPDTGIEGARVVAENIRQTIEGASIINPNNKQIVSKVTISIGMTELFEGEDLETMIVRADRALYTAKENGRNRVVEADCEGLAPPSGGNAYGSEAMNMAM
jgi:diguanylate cyclase